MEFTGERFVPTLQGDIRLEHFHRYHWCLPYVAGKRVLDIACGEGYGSRILASRASSVQGVDISEEAVEHARHAYAGVEGLEFKQGDAAVIPLPDSCVDVVVSFETIEHHDRHDEMMSEIRRVLTDDGLLIISSPNKRIYSDLAGGDHNHFHVKELYFDEFDALLRAHFASVVHFGQRVTAGSLLQPLKGEPGSGLQVYTETSGGVEHTNPHGIEAMYYMAVASNRELPALPSASIFLSEVDNPFYEKQREVLELGAEIRRMSDYIAEVNAVLALRDKDIEYLRGNVNEAGAEINRLHTELSEAGQEIERIRSILVATEQSLNSTVDMRCRRILRRIRGLLTGKK